MSKIEVKENIDRLIFKTWNIYSNAMSFLKGNKLIKINKNLKNIHNMQRCFILGTGPSLSRLDLEMISSEQVIGVNFLFKFHDFDKLNIVYYFFLDEVFYNKYASELIRLVIDMPHTIFILREKAFYILGDKIKYSNNVRFIRMNQVQYGDYINVDMGSNMTATYNVMIGAIQCAIYMGYKKIFLLGADFNSFANSTSVHCYDGDNIVPRQISLADELKFYSMMAYQHYAINKFVKKEGVDICNLTENSLLDTYRKGSLEKEINIINNNSAKSVKGRVIWKK